MLLVLAIQRTRQETRALHAKAVATGQAGARRTAQAISEELAGLAQVAHGLVTDLENGRLPPEAIGARLGPVLDKAPPSIARMGVLFRPGGQGGVPARLAPHAARDRGTLRVYDYGSQGDYTLKPWFKPDQGRPTWAEPHRSSDGATFLVDYLEPFRLPGAAAPSGLVRLEVTLAHLQKRLQDLGMGHEGYAYLLSARTAFIAFPMPELVREGRTLADLATERGDPGQAYLAECALKGRPGHADTAALATGQDGITFLEPVPSAGWSACVLLFRDDLKLEPADLNRQMLRIVTLAVALAWVLIFLAFKGPWLAPWSLWWTVALGSIAVAAGMGVLFRFAYVTPPAGPDNEIQMMDALSLERFKASNGSLMSGLDSVKAEFVPTGVFLQTMEITGPSQVKITGMVWQRLPKGTPREQRGVTLPEALAGEISVGAEKEEKDWVVQFYPFRVTVEPDLDSTRIYPFDRIRARLRIWPKAIHGNQILVPDLASYPVLAFGNGPGMDPELSLPGWDVEGNEFVYLLENYNTRLGAEGFLRERRSPELVMTIRMRRQWLGPCIMVFLPLLAVAGLLFTLTLTVSQDGPWAKVTGYSFLNFLRTTIALFFSLVVSQFNIRNRIVASGVLNLEWYYFILYAFILLVSVDALAYARDSGHGLRAGDNAWVKRAFWPVLMASYFAVTTLFVL
ncbi:MAG: hypothetical protein HGA66_03285 [Holophaga sp.]|nr:hypothetical protein [Holophaga sp.]